MKSVCPRPVPCGWSLEQTLTQGVCSPIFHLFDSTTDVPPTLTQASFLEAPASSQSWVLSVPGTGRGGSLPRPTYHTIPGIGRGAPSCQGLEPHLGVAKELVAKSIKNRDSLPGPALCRCQRNDLPLWRTGPVPSHSPGCLSDQNTGDQLTCSGQWSSKGLPWDRWEPKGGREGSSRWPRSGVGRG